MKKKVVFLAYTDYANTMTHWSKCLNDNSEKITSKIFAVRPHPYDYEIKHDGDLLGVSEDRWREMKFDIYDADVIVVANEGGPAAPNGLIERFDAPRGTKTIIRNPGTFYRDRYLRFNKESYRDKFHKILYTQDLWRLSPKASKDIPMRSMFLFDFDKDDFISSFKKKIEAKKRILGHNPSSQKKKGTDSIQKAIRSASFDRDKIKVSIQKEKLSHKDAIKKKSECLFYIDQFEPSIGGYGVSAVEALSLGCVVLSSTNNALYEDNIISLGVDMKSLIKSIESALNMTDEELYEYAEKSAYVLERFYSQQAVCRNLERILLT